MSYALRILAILFVRVAISVVEEPFTQGVYLSRRHPSLRKKVGQWDEVRSEKSSSVSSPSNLHRNIESTAPTSLAHTLMGWTLAKLPRQRNKGAEQAGGERGNKVSLPKSHRTKKEELRTRRASCTKRTLHLTSCIISCALVRGKHERIMNTRGRISFMWYMTGAATRNTTAVAAHKKKEAKHGREPRSLLRRLTLSCFFLGGLSN